MGGSLKNIRVTTRNTSQIRLMTYAPAVMELKVTKPSWIEGTLAMGTASNGPKAIPAALHVTNAANTPQTCQIQVLTISKYNVNEASVCHRNKY